MNSEIVHLSNELINQLQLLTSSIINLQSIKNDQYHQNKKHINRFETESQLRKFKRLETEYDHKFEIYKRTDEIFQYSQTTDDPQ